jgi:hypothetical protein
MTFKVTVRDKQGNLVNDVEVSVNDLITGQLFSRSTNAGYADCAVFPPATVGDRITLKVADPQFRFKGLVQGDAYEVTADDQVLEFTLDPFV